ncbi:MAG: DUF167 domain-containing protein [Tepidisphaera sp.]|nr:DUF167 domain-containing protein [Tepidisphaera sp.]
MITDEPAQNAKSPAACRIDLKVVPGSRATAVVGRLGERLKVKVAAPPEGGKANRAVCELLAEVLGVSERAVSIIAGHGSAEKTARVEGVSAAAARKKLDLEDGR